VTERRFPPPWSVEELDAYFVVRDGNGQQIIYVYFEEEPGRRSAVKQRRGRVAANIALNGTSMGQTALMAPTETSS
jgi:hypothetical protein